MMMIMIDWLISFTFSHPLSLRRIDKNCSINIIHLSFFFLCTDDRAPLFYFRNEYTIDGISVIMEMDGSLSFLHQSIIPEVIHCRIYLPNK